MSDVVLLANGRRFEGWEEIEVTRSMQAIAGRFTLTVSERFPGNPTRWEVAQGTPCEVLLDGHTVITGYVDSRSASFSSTNHTVNLTGRDRSGDMVDSAPEIGTYELSGQNALQIAQRLSKPFNIPFSAGASGLKKLDRFDIQPGETAFEAVSRACQMSAVLPIPQGDGSVVIERESSGRAYTELVEGENIITASLSKSDEDRFNRYVVAGQHFGTDELFGEEAATPRAEASDPNIRASRVLYLRPSSNMTQAQAQERATWEAANRAAAGVQASVTVQGWRQGNGELWPINRVVRVVSPTLAIQNDMLIVGVKFTLGAEGTRTVLSLAPRGSFKPEPVVPDSEGGGIAWDKVFNNDESD